MTKKNIYWNEALKVIPGGNLLYSKRPEMFLPNNWPTYFTKSKNCYVWDKNNKKYIDMIFAVGTNVLGYGNTKVDNFVKKTIDKGNMTTLNSYEENISFNLSQLGITRRKEYEIFSISSSSNV